jgi:hypothetical protein
MYLMIFHEEGARAAHVYLPFAQTSFNVRGQSPHEPPALRCFPLKPYLDLGFLCGVP